MNYSETPPWAYPASPQNQGNYGYEESRSPSNNSSSSNSHYGSPAPASPPNANSDNYYGASHGSTQPVSAYPNADYCVSPDNAAYLSGNDNNGYASPGLSPGDWNTASPNYTSPDQHTHYSYASPRSQDGNTGTTPHPTPSRASVEPFMYKDPSTAEIPTLETNDKNDLDIRRQMAAGAKAKYLLQEVCMSNQGHATRPPNAGNQYMNPYNDPLKRQGHRRIFVSKEKLATSTRKKKAVTPEEDFETLTDYKCQLDIDRQKEAKNKALKLLSYF